MRFGRNSEARKVWYRKRKTPKCHFRFCGTVNKRRALLPKRGALQVVKPKIRLWYFCGQMRNRRGKNHGDFQFWWTVRGSNPRPRRCERRALPAELTAQISHFSIKKVAKNRFLRYSILREKSGKSDEKLEGKIGPVMEVHTDANAALSQLSYEPKLILQRQMLLYHNFLHCKDCFFQKDENFLLPICR